jgi:predicted transcriptional regulator
MGGLNTESRITFFLPAELHEAVSDLAQAHDRPVSREIRRALTEYVERHRGDETGETTG